MNTQSHLATLLARIGWKLYPLLIVILAVLPFQHRVAEPQNATRISSASLMTPLTSSTTVSLPHRWRAAHPSAGNVSYRFTFEVASELETPLYLYIPNFKRSARAWLNGKFFYDSNVRKTWVGALQQNTDIAELPASLLNRGSNQIELSISSAGPQLHQLSELYIGTHDEIVPFYKQRVWINERLLAMSYAVQVLLTVGILTIFSLRRQDRFLGWLGVTVGLSSIFGITQFVDFLPAITHMFPAIFLLGPSIGGAGVLFALALTGFREPKALVWSICALPFLLYLISLFGGPNLAQLSIFVAIPLMIVGALTASVILVWGGWGLKSNESKLVAGPWILITIYTIYDLIISTGRLEGSSFVNPTGRALFITIIVIILMRRLSSSLTAAESSETVLHHRLAQQKVSLGEDFALQKISLKKSTIENERRRLISELHDGMGSHLTTILALSEKGHAHDSDIFKVAQEALTDLRIVLFSLDGDDDNIDVHYALAMYRQQVSSRLTNIGINFEWSMTHLPEISGIGPGHVLNILRILQEAITNALKHGEPTQIKVHGQPGVSETATIVVENMGGKCVAADQSPHGFGLSSMRARAALLGGSVTLTPTADGARLLLSFPIQLPQEMSVSG